MGTTPRRRGERGEPEAGREIDTAGDGFLATFDGPARAIRCALATADAVQPLGFEVSLAGTDRHEGE